MTNKESGHEKIIVYMDGGLASQMTSYSFGECLRDKGYSPTFDLSWFDRYGRDRFLLKKVFGIDIEEATNLGKYRIYSSPNIGARFVKKSKLINLGIWAGTIPKLCYTVKPIYSGYRFSLDNLNSIEEMLKLESDIYFWGYWSFFVYIEKNASHIRKIFRFPGISDETNKGILEMIRSENSVGIHVRRGDYLKYPKVFHELTLGYYNRAVEIMKNELDSPRFFVFSDDIKWCKEQFQQIGLSDKETNYVTGNEGDNAYIDMSLMKACKNNIVANSGFSLWAGFLNENTGKRVIAPKKYFADSWCIRNGGDIYRIPEKSWILIEN